MRAEIVSASAIHSTLDIVSIASFRLCECFLGSTPLLRTDSAEHLTGCPMTCAAAATSTVSQQYKYIPAISHTSQPVGPSIRLTPCPQWTVITGHAALDDSEDVSLRRVCLRRSARWASALNAERRCLRQRCAQVQVVGPWCSNCQGACRECFYLRMFTSLGRRSCSHSFKCPRSLSRPRPRPVSYREMPTDHRRRGQVTGSSLILLHSSGSPGFSQMHR